MAKFEPITRRMICRGMDVNHPVDLMPEGKFPKLINVRSYFDGAFQTREGLTKLNSAQLAQQNIHSLFRLNDGTSFNGGKPSVRYAGSGTVLYSGTVANPTVYTSLDTAWSGNPMQAVSMAPIQSPQPWLYIVDGTKQRKTNVNGSIFDIGISAPLVAPSATLAAPQITTITEFANAADWAAAGAVAAAPTNVTRVNTTISKILYDSGNTGWALIVPTAFTNIGTGTLLRLAATETVLVTDVKIPVASTTVGSIIYDSGVTGLCTIQPVASLGTGQLSATNWAALAERSGYAVPRNQADTPLAVAGMSSANKEIPTIRQLDFPVDCLVTVGGENVRILSAAVGQDGVQSFRCSTTATRSAGDAIVGFAAIRAYLTTTRAAGDAITSTAIQNVLTPVGASAMTGGVQETTLAVNLALVGTRATLPDDDLHISLKVDNLMDVTEIRVYLDVDAATNSFLQNYYFYAADANAIAASVQGSNAAVVSSLMSGRTTAVQQAQIIAPIGTTDESIQVRRPAVDRSESAVNPSTSSVLQPAPTSISSRQPIRTAPPSSSNATPGSLALGNSQWMELRFKVKDLTRVGTDMSRTLANVAAVEILVTSNGAHALTVQYGSFWLSGGYGADVGDVGVPYVYAKRYRSSVTGAKSNPSPATRASVVPRRNRVVLTSSASGDSQVDLDDWFKLGGQLTRFTYIGSAPTGDTFNDDFSDARVEGGDGLSFDLFKPWPTTDLPRTGTCNTAGSAVKWVSGDTFNTKWAPGSAIIINGMTCTLYAQPASTTFLEINENVGTGAAVDFFLPQPTLVDSKLPVIWGPSRDQFCFACGDTNNPGFLQWTHANDPDTTSDKFNLYVTSPSEPLMNGCIYDGRCFVFSTERLYEIEPAYDSPSMFKPIETPCTEGLWSKYAMCVTTKGIAFLGKDGIYLTQAGSKPISLTDEALYPWFPHDTSPGVTVNGIPPVDMTQTTALRLCESNGWLIFDYKDTSGDRRSLNMRMSDGSWWMDVFTPGATLHYSEPGEDVNELLMASAQGNIFTSGGLTDDGAAYSGTLWTPADDAGNSRIVKLIGDVGISADPGTAGSLTVQGAYNNFTQTLASTPMFTGGAGRTIEQLDINSGDGVLATNFGLIVTLSPSASPTQIYWWSPAWIAKGETSNRRATDWDNLGYVGSKWIQGVVLRADTFGAARQLEVQYDGGAIALTITVTMSGETQIAFPDSGTWTPFMAELVRLVPISGSSWRLYDWRWVWEPAPELATSWIAQPTTFDFPGYFTVHDAVIAHMSTSDLTLTFQYNDGTTVTRTVPHSSGLYRRDYVLLPVGKGLSAAPSITSTAPCRIFKRDCSIRVQGWGMPGGYAVISAFGGPSRSSGAEI